jgi:hypothetical protein
VGNILGGQVTLHNCLQGVRAFSRIRSVDWV